MFGCGTERAGETHAKGTLAGWHYKRLIVAMHKINHALHVRGLTWSRKKKNDWLDEREVSGQSLPASRTTSWGNDVERPSPLALLPSVAPAVKPLPRDTLTAIDIRSVSPGDVYVTLSCPQEGFSRHRPTWACEWWKQLGNVFANVRWYLQIKSVTLASVCDGWEAFGWSLCQAIEMFYRMGERREKNMCVLKKALLK